MAFATGSATPNATIEGSVSDLRWFVFALFFIFGGITSLNDVLIPKLKHLFTLSYAEVMLVQSAFFLGRVDEFEPVSGGGDMDHAHEAGGELIVAGGNGTVDFQTAEHALDAVALLVERPVMVDLHPAV